MTGIVEFAVGLAAVILENFPVTELEIVVATQKVGVVREVGIELMTVAVCVVFGAEGPANDTGRGVGIRRFVYMREPWIKQVVPQPGRIQRRPVAEN